jgi:hypothetical protein
MRKYKSVQCTSVGLMYRYTGIWQSKCSMPCLYFDVVVGLDWSNDPESNAGGSVASGRASHSRQVKGDDPDKKGHPGPPYWGLCVELTASTRKKIIVLKPHEIEEVRAQWCRNVIAPCT